MLVSMPQAFVTLPKSPRWLIARNKRQAALRNMVRLDFGPDEIRHDLVDPEGAQPQLSLRGIMDLFKKKYRFRTSLALFILGMVQLCGIDGVLYVWQLPLPRPGSSSVADGRGPS